VCCALENVDIGRGSRHRPIGRMSYTVVRMLFSTGRRGAVDAPQYS